MSNHRPRRAAVPIVIVVLALLAAACGSDPARRAGPGVSGDPPTSGVPTTSIDPRYDYRGDDFYTASASNLPGTHGQLLRAQVLTDLSLTDAVGWRILYRSESADGRPVSVSGMVFAPKAPSSTPRPVVAWAHGTVGSADACAPSRTYQRDFANPDPVLTAIRNQIQRFIDRGYVVVATDYEGLGTPGPHPYLVGISAGRNVLDSVLAVTGLPGAGAGRRAVVYGLSQGGHAAMWAGELASTWTPALELQGVVAAAPFSELELLLPASASLSGAQGFSVLGAAGFTAAYPASNMVSVLRDDVRAQVGLVEQLCLVDLQRTVQSIAGTTSVFSRDLLADPTLRDLLLSTKPGNVRPGAPVLIVQGENDTTVPAFTTRILEARLCGLGANVSSVYLPGVGHGASIVGGNDALMRWIDDRLSGTPATTGCAR
jgi:pimeloyl-ACP methyl ester carboxylesterase